MGVVRQSTALFSFGVSKMLRSDIWGALPGLTTAAETYESAIRWGPGPQGILTGGVINANTIDVGNSPTFELRIGLVLGLITASGQWTQYSPTATDGSNVACGVLVTSLRMQDFQGVNQARFFGILVGGSVQAAKLLGLDQMARQQMDKFIFDDDFCGKHWFPYKQLQTKTANYSIVATDNFSIFDNTGAAGAVTFTLPAIANGYDFWFHVTADQNLLVTSNEGTNIVAFNNASASTVSFQTGGARIGGAFQIVSNPAGTKWYVFNESAGANTVTVA